MIWTPMEAPRLLTAEERRELRTLYLWRHRGDRPIALTGLVGLGHHELGPGLVVAVTFAPRSGRATVTCERRQVGQFVMGRNGQLYPKWALDRWAERHHAPAGAMTALRRRLELVLTSQMEGEGGLWAAACAERRARAAGPASVRPTTATGEERAS